MVRSVIARASAAAALALSGAGAQAQIFSDNFDSYQAGSGLAGQGGWELWCHPAALDATVSDAQSSSEPNSMLVTPATDIVQRLNETSGQLVFSFFVYVASSASGGSGSINLMNSYCPNPIGWSASTTFNPDTNLVTAFAGGETTALIENEWVEYRAEIDLDNDSLNEFYGDTQFVFDAVWTTNISPGPLALVAADFYSDLLTEIYFDTVTLERAGGGCYPDFTGDGTLDLFDFLSYVNAFNDGDPNADCTDDGLLDLFDFLCFVNAFNDGC